MFQYHEIQKFKVMVNSGNIGQFKPGYFPPTFFGIKTEYDGPKALVWWHDTVLFSQFFPHVSSSNIRLLFELVAFKFFSLAGNFCPRSAPPV